MKLNFDTLSAWYNQPLDTLEQVNAKKKDLSGVEDISSCSKLRKLVLSENTLTNDNTTFTGLDHLTFLDLSHNEFNSLDGLENLTHLTVLNASNNAITALPEDMTHLKSLKAIILNNNELTKVARLNELTELNTIVISHNSITKVPTLLSLSKLVKLSASHNKLKEIPNFSGQTASLKEIRLNDNRIITIPSTLRQCQALEIVNLGNNKISKWSDIASLGSLLNLHDLNLKGNPITKNKDYKNKIMALVPSLRVLDGERFDLKFLERKQKQSTNLKLMEKKDRLKREKLEKQLEADYGLEAPSKKPRHKHILREEEGSSKTTKNKVDGDKKAVKKDIDGDKKAVKKDIDGDKKAVKKDIDGDKKAVKKDIDGDKKKTAKKNDDGDKKAVKKGDDRDKKAAKKGDDHEKKKTTEDGTSDKKKKKRTIEEETTPKPLKKKKHDAFFNPTTETTDIAKEEPVPAKPTVDEPTESNLQKRKADKPASHHDRSGVLSVVDRSKKLKKKAAGDDVVSALEQLAKKQEEQVSSGLGADAWD